MLLEAGLKREDPPRHLRRRSSMGNFTTYYESRLKLAAVGFFSVWVFVIMYYGTASLPMGSTATTNAHSRLEKGSTELAFPEETNFLVIGDYGTGNRDQVKVAETMKRFARTLNPKPAFVLSTGDQIYDHGIQSPNDPALKARFENMYDSPELQIPWYITIGNHDCEGSVDALLQYAKKEDSLWYLPRRYYSLDRPVAPKTILRIVVLDVCDLVCGKEPRDARCNGAMIDQSSPVTRKRQYHWVDTVLSAPKPPGVERMWKVVIGHWGVYSYAGNANTQELIDHLDPLLQKYHVHAYINGHDHCLQHIRNDSAGWTRNFFVAGAGGYRVHELQPKARANPDLVHAAMTHGFMYMRITTEFFRVQFIDKDEEILYTTDVKYS